MKELKEKEEQESIKNTLNELSDRELNKVNGGTQAEADEWLETLMKYYNVTSKEEMLQKMSDEQRHIYQLMVANADFDEVYDMLD